MYPASLEPRWIMDSAEKHIPLLFPMIGSENHFQYFPAMGVRATTTGVEVATI